MGGKAGGDWLRYLVSADAFLVLSGGVLTSFVGVTGLIRRMSLDRLLPQFFLITNTWRGTNHWIIITFFTVCSAMYLMLNGQLNSLAGVYTIAFLSVMFLFACGDFILKYKRRRIPREIRAIKTSIYIAMFGCIAAFIANIKGDPENLGWFAVYYSCTAFVVMTMMFRVKVLKVFIYMLPNRRWMKFLALPLVNLAQRINNIQYVFLTSSADIALLNKAVLYVRNNELTDNLKIVHVYENESEMLNKLVQNVKVLDQIYPKMRLDFVGIKGKFSVEMIDTISQTLQVPKNLIFISCPSSKFGINVEQLGGVRIITTSSQ